MIDTTDSKIHWNYFIALEQDLETISRYIEFSKQNFSTYSIELAHLLFAAASEVDVIAKMLCKRFQPTAKRESINDYRPILVAELPELPKLKVFVPRYDLSFKPWSNWVNSKSNNPLWWCSYNEVKHKRDIYFNKATLKNALNALGALLILVYYHYSYELKNSETNKLSPKDTTQKLKPESTLLRLPEDYYYGKLLV